MPEDNKEILTDEEINSLSIDELAELKVELEDTISKIDSLIDQCNDALNS